MYGIFMILFYISSFKSSQNLNVPTHTTLSLMFIYNKPKLPVHHIASLNYRETICLTYVNKNYISQANIYTSYHIHKTISKIHYYTKK